MAKAMDVHRKLMQSVIDRDWDAMRALYHPDYTYWCSDGSEGAGPDAGVAVAQHFVAAFPDLSFEVTAQLAVNHTSVLEMTARGTHTGPLGDLAPTGRVAETAVCNIIEIRDGLIWREREYYDSMALMNQLTATITLPDQATAPENQPQPIV